MNIENPEYNPVCRVQVDRFTLQTNNGSRIKSKCWDASRKVFYTDFFNHIKMSAADFIKRRQL